MVSQKSKMNSKVFTFPMSRNHSSKSQKREFWSNFVLQYLQWPSQHLKFHNMKPIKVVKPTLKKSCAGKGLGSSSHFKSDLCSFCSLQISP